MPGERSPCAVLPAATSSIRKTPSRCHKHVDRQFRGSSALTQIAASFNIHCGRGLPQPHYLIRHDQSLQHPRIGRPRSRNKPIVLSVMSGSRSLGALLDAERESQRGQLYNLRFRSNVIWPNGDNGVFPQFESYASDDVTAR